jgi:hypothetical protein
LSSPHLEASPATTFRACSSPAPTPVKPQPASAILSQESTHTTLSITHYTRKWPTTGPRTTHGPHKSRRRIPRGDRALTPPSSHGRWSTGGGGGAQAKLPASCARRRFSRSVEVEVPATACYVELRRRPDARSGLLELRRHPHACLPAPACSSYVDARSPATPSLPLLAAAGSNC